MLMKVNEQLKLERERYETRKKNGNYGMAADAAIVVAQMYKDSDEFDKALEFYENAKHCLTKVSQKTDKDLSNEFMIYRGCVEAISMFYGKSTNKKDQRKIIKVLDEFLEYSKTLEDPSHQQIALHVAAQIYQDYLDLIDDYLAEAKKYARESLELLKRSGPKIDKIVADRCKNNPDLVPDYSKRRRAGLYQLLAGICEDEGNLTEALEYCNQALEYDRLEKDPKLHYSLLHAKRRFVDRSQKYAISEKLIKILPRLEQKDCVALTEETRFFFAEDCLIQKNLKEARDSFWDVYKCPKGESEQRKWKKEAKDKLIQLYKVMQRLKELSKLEETQPLDHRKIAKFCEKIADALCEIKAFEFAIDYYFKMKDAAAQLEGDPEYGDLEISRGSMLSLAITYSINLNNHDEAIQYYEKLYTIQIRLSSPPHVLADTRLDIAISKSFSDFYSFEDQKNAFEKVKMPKDNIVLYEKYLEGYIQFLKNHKNKEGIPASLEDLHDELQKYRKLQSDSQDTTDDDDGVIPTESSQDALDQLEPDEIFEAVKRHYKNLKDIELKKKKINILNQWGESGLHTAAQTSLKEVKLLIEKCGYQRHINSVDGGGWTPLSEAVIYGHADIVRYLISKGAKVNTSSKVELKGVDGNTCSGSKQTPLMEACTNGFFEIICILIQNGANPCMINANGWTAGDYLEQFIQNELTNSKDFDKYNYVLKHLREMEARAGIKNHQKKLVDLPENFSKRKIPKYINRKPEEAGVEMFKAALAHLGRNPSRRNFAASAPKGKDHACEDDDEMLDDEDRKFIAPESDDEDADVGWHGRCTRESSADDDAMEVDDDNFRQNHGFRSGTPRPIGKRRSSGTPATKPKRPPPKQRSNRRSNIVDDEEDDVIEIVGSEESEAENFTPENRKRTRESLKRRSSNRSFESSSSSKKTKQSDSISKKSSSNTVTRMVDSLSLILSPKFDYDAKELDFSFSEDALQVSTNLKLHRNLYKLDMKGSDFDEGIDEVVDAICSCSKLIELDLSQVEQIESIHANKILKSCSKLKVLDLYGTAVKVVDLQEKYVLERLVIAKSPFEFSAGFYDQINAHRTLSFLDASHTGIELNELVSRLTTNRTTKLHIKAAPIASHLNVYELTTTLSKMNDSQNFVIKLSRALREEILRLDSSIQRFLD